MKTWLLLGLAAALWSCGTLKPQRDVPGRHAGLVAANGITLAYERRHFFSLSGPAAGLVENWIAKKIASVRLKAHSRR